MATVTTPFNLVLSKIIRISEINNDDDNDSYYPLDAASLFVEPHGGRLVHCEIDTEEAQETLPHLVVSDQVLMHCEQFGYGTYSPLTGFMDQDTLESVNPR